MRRCAAPRSATSRCSRATSGSPRSYGEIVAVGHGFELRPRLELTDDAVIVDAQGMVAVPGLVDCHTHACFAGDRVDEFDRRARGATYEELHAAGGGILSTVEATRAAGLDALTEQVAPPPALDARARHDVGRDQVRLRARPRERARHAPRDPRGGCGRLAARLLDRARGAHRAARGRRRRRVHPALRRRDPSRGGRVGARHARRRVLRARRIRRRAVAPLPRRRPASSGSSCDCTATSSRRSARSRWRSSWPPGRSTTSRRPGPRASRRSRRPT